MRKAGATDATAWLLSQMKEGGVEPDEYTVCTLLRDQPDLHSSRHVWQWARKQVGPCCVATPLPHDTPSPCDTPSPGARPPQRRMAPLG